MKHMGKKRWKKLGKTCLGYLKMMKQVKQTVENKLLQTCAQIVKNKETCWEKQVLESV